MNPDISNSTADSILAVGAIGVLCVRCLIAIFVLSWFSYTPFIGYGG
jgi:hypothetical protein